MHMAGDICDIRTYVCIHTQYVCLCVSFIASELSGNVEGNQSNRAAQRHCKRSTRSEEAFEV